MEQLFIQLLGNTPGLVVSLLLWNEIRAIRVEFKDHKDFCKEWRKAKRC